MLDLLIDEANMTITENGAAAYESTGSYCLDLFSSIGAMREADEERIINLFIRAYMESPNTAMKILFFARDIRGGLGERRVFRVILRWLAENKPGSVIKNMGLIPEYGRYDDYLELFDTALEHHSINELIMAFLSDLAMLEKGEQVSLLAKWLPSVNASSDVTVKRAKKLARALGITDSEYRKDLSKLRKKIDIIENHLRTGDYSFDYSKQASVAMFKYRKAFMRNDGNRYSAFIDKVMNKEVTMHTDNIMPYTIVEEMLSDDGYGGKVVSKIADETVLNATWNSLPDYKYDENALVIIDTSGSMYCQGSPTPAAVALSLGLYFADHNKGFFKNCVMEFSAKPRLIKIKGKSFADRLKYLLTFNEVANTDLQAVFDLILKTAVKNNLSQSEMPSKLMIISDMEFDACTDNASDTVFENAKKQYEAAGYILPLIVFWNVADRNGHKPVKSDERGVTLVSGVTPRLFEMVAGGEMSPLHFMNEILGSERYKDIVA